MLGVSRSGYYGWLTRSPSPRQLADEALAAVILDIHRQFACYGSPRVHQELRARNHHVGVNRVARLMRERGIRARRGPVKSRPRSAPPRRRPEVGDLIRRDFQAIAPNRLWCVDITQIRTREGWLCVAAVLDAYSRKIISWSVADRQHLELALEALDGALAARRPPPGLIVHSDRGFQFTSWEWLDRLRSRGHQPSIGETASALDNALIEAWFSSMKNEAFHPYPVPAARHQARQTLFQHINFHNNHRRHSALAYTNPTHYEAITTRVSA